MRGDILLDASPEGQGLRGFESGRILRRAPLVERIDSFEQQAPGGKRAVSRLAQADELDRAEPHGARPPVDAVTE
jgi:hypothetical protein